MLREWNKFVLYAQICWSTTVLVHHLPLQLQSLLPIGQLLLQELDGRLQLEAGATIAFESRWQLRDRSNIH